MNSEQHSTNKNLLNLLQAEVPVAERPFAEIGEPPGTSEDDGRHKPSGSPPNCVQNTRPCSMWWLWLSDHGGRLYMVGADCGRVFLFQY